MALSRRTLMLTAAGLPAGASLLAGAATAATAPISRIAFGSCAHQDKDQPIWDAVLAARPDLFVFLGDNVYIDSRNPDDYAKAYAKLAAKPGFRKLRENVPILAIWDDHDFGDDDQDRTFALKEHSKQVFLDFWGVPKDAPRRQRDGIYDAVVFGPDGKRLQIILPDLRYNKTPNVKADLGGMEYRAWAKARDAAGLSVPGPYARTADRSATQLGEAQWAWLEQQLRQPADVRIFASSLQVLADFPGWEEWANYAHDQQRLFELIRTTGANGLFFISGDTHYGEISKVDVNVPYPLYDITSSGLTEVWPVLPPNDNRVGEAYRDQNFGLISIDWLNDPVTVSVEIRDVGGQVKISHRLSLSTLSAPVY